MDTIHLQGIGEVKAKRAGDLIVGDILSWNHSPRSYEVVDIQPCGKKSIYMTEKSLTTGKVNTRRMLKTRLVAA